MNVDYVIVGSGLTGATIARLLADDGREVIVLERRSHIGGNIYDDVHESGIRFHVYGPHYFRTSSERIWRFVNRFDRFYRVAATVMTDVGGRLVHWPVTEDYITSNVGPAWVPGFIGTPCNFEEASLARMPRIVYEAFVKEYTEKQWGVPADTLSASLARRFTVRPTGSTRLTMHRWQGLPYRGFAYFVRQLLAGIPVVTEHDHLARRTEYVARRQLVFTGPIDEYFGFEAGRLMYRAQRRVHWYEPCRDFLQPVVQVNNPTHAGGLHVRTIEWKHLMPVDTLRGIVGTLLTTETPFTPDAPGDFEYPFPDERNRALYARYRRRAGGLRSTIIAGRLGEYRYFDMDQAIGRAIVIASRLTG